MRERIAHTSVKQKSLLAYAITATLMLTLVAGCSAKGDETSALKTDTQSASPVPSTVTEKLSYTELDYGGVDTIPQKISNFCEVTSDSAFVANIWDELNYDAWTVRESGSVAMVSIHLDFSGSSTPLSLEIDPNDVGWRKEAQDGNNAVTNINYDLPKGTYERISRLLTEYTSAHFMPQISPTNLSIATDSSVPLSFSCNELYFVVSPSVTGNFTEDWKADTWVESTLEEVTMDSNAIRIGNVYNSDGTGPIDILVDANQLLVIISHEGLSRTYEISLEVAQTILEQFDQFQWLSKEQQ